MVFGRDSLRIGDDFLPLIQIMTGDYMESTRCGAYQCLEYLFLSKPQSLLSCIKSLSASIVRYPKDKVPLLYALSVLAYRHSRLLEPIWTELVLQNVEYSVSNLKHLCLAVILFYGQQSNDYLTESIPSSMTQFITACKLENAALFEHSMDRIVDCESAGDVNQPEPLKSVMDDVANWNLYGTELLTLNGYLERIFEGKSCDLNSMKSLNSIIRSLQTLDMKHRERVHRFLSLWRILGDILQCIELALCGGIVPSKVIQVEHHCVLLHRMCSDASGTPIGRWHNLCNLLLAASECLYLIVGHQVIVKKQTVKMEGIQSIESFDRLKVQLTALKAGTTSLWQCLGAVWKGHINGGDIMKCLREYTEFVDYLKSSSPIGKRVSLEHVVELKSEHKIYFHPLAPIDIPIQCVVIPQYARYIEPKLKVTVTPKMLKPDMKPMEMIYSVFSKKRWVKEVDSKSNHYVTFTLTLPSLVPSTNMNPAKNYYADIAVEMISDAKAISSEIIKMIPEYDCDVVVSNRLSVSIAIGSS